MNKLITDAIAWVNEDLGDGWHSWAHSSNGNWCRLYHMKLGISIELRINEEDRVMAKPYCSVLGFSGMVEGMELCLPNSHLYTVICQLETIKHFLPKDNINDYYHEVAVAHMMAERKRRRAEREKAKREQDS